MNKTYERETDRERKNIKIEKKMNDIERNEIQRFRERENVKVEKK